MTLAKNAFEAYSTYIFTHKKNAPNTKLFFQCRLMSLLSVRTVF